jgi:putative holliday junction resolvase
VNAAANPSSARSRKTINPVLRRCLSLGTISQQGPACGETGLAYNKKSMRTNAHASIKANPRSAESESRCRRILAIDYGRRRIGLALSDELGLTAQPLMTLERSNRRSDLRRLREICSRHSVTHILVGHPLHISGEAGEMADEAAQFAKRLEREFGMQVELVDERLTTWEAEQTMAETRPSSRRKRRVLDDVAAAVLLRDYLEHRCGHVSSNGTEKS